MVLSFQGTSFISDGELCSYPLYGFIVIIIIITMLFILAFLGMLAINWQTDVLLYGASCVLLCHWLVTSCG